MRHSLLLLFCIGLSCSHGVVGEDEVLVKKGAYPFMAFIYYSDPSVVDVTGSRYIRSAVLIRADWLVTSALGPSVTDGNGFPRKTLLARVGAVTIDVNCTFNEDEDEQEREVIQIVRPYNHSATQWWLTDISLVKTLLPFNTSAAVQTKSINMKKEFTEKTCIILFYTKKYANRTDDKALMQLLVDILPSTMESCGRYFAANTMTCASDSDESKDAIYDPNFCKGNGGGPLICEGEVMGLQTYVDNNCKQPHLYQLLSSWDDFITCGIEEKCQEEQCGKICDVTYKDAPKTDAPITMLITEPVSTTAQSLSTTSALPEIINPEGEIPTTLLSTMEEIVTETTTLSTEGSIMTFKPTLTSNYNETTETIPWPKERTEERKKLVDYEDERNARIETHQQVFKKRSAGDRNMCFVQTVMFGLVLCLF